MSDATYIVSPDTFRELDALMNLMESEILDGDMHGDAEDLKMYYRYQGLRECVTFLRTLVYDLPEQNTEISSLYKYTEAYVGKEYEIEEEDN